MQTHAHTCTHTYAQPCTHTPHTPFHQCPPVTLAAKLGCAQQRHTNIHAHTHTHAHAHAHACTNTGHTTTPDEPLMKQPTHLFISALL
jgi:hypothetical protein